MPFKSKITNKILGKKINISFFDMPKSIFQKFLQSDIEDTFGGKAKDLKELVTKGKFAFYEGDAANFVQLTESKQELNFLVTTYIGKMLNNLKSNFKNPDLSTLAFVSRLNAFASEVERLTEKPTTVTLCAENDLFDKDILKLKEPNTDKMVNGTINYSKEFGFDKIKFRNLSEMTGGKAYYDQFQKSVKNFENKKDELDKIENFDKIYGTFFSSYPTTSFDEAIKLYTNPESLSKIKEWALECIVRYFAFHEARATVDFWKINSGFIRTTVSNRNEVLRFDYSIGRMSPLHGVSTVKKDKINTEYYYDLISSAKTDTANLKVLRYEGAPFCIDLN